MWYSLQKMPESTGFLLQWSHGELFAEDLSNERCLLGFFIQLLGLGLKKNVWNHDEPWCLLMFDDAW